MFELFQIKKGNMKYRQFEKNFDIKEYPQLKHVTKCWIAENENNEYMVLLNKPGYEIEHLRITRTDNEPIRNWSDMQQIKNDLLGKETIAIEIFPKDSDLIDYSNTYHLWTFPGLTVPNLKELYQYPKDY